MPVVSCWRWNIPDMGKPRWEVMTDGIITAFGTPDDSHLELGTDEGWWVSC
jgi:hypothetical protein